MLDKILSISVTNDISNLVCLETGVAILKIFAKLISRENNKIFKLMIDFTTAKKIFENFFLDIRTP